MAFGKSSHLIIVPDQTGSAQTTSQKLDRSIRRNQHIWWIVLILIAVIPGVVIWGVGRTNFTASPFSYSPIWWLLAVLPLLTAVSLSIRWLRWHFLTRHFNLRLPTKNGFKFFFVTLSASITPLHIGELLRAPLLVRRYPQATSVIPTIWVVERLGDAFALGLFLLAMQKHWLALSTLIGLAVLFIAILRITFKNRTINALTQPAMLSMVILSSTMVWAMAVLGLGFVFNHLQARDTYSLLPLAIFAAVTTGISLFTGLAAWLRWRVSFAEMLQPGPPTNHFDAIAPTYSQQIPPHVRQRLLTRKIEIMQQTLQTAGLPSNARGLDLGCGPGWYAGQMAQLGYTVNACDLAARQVAAAKKQAGLEKVEFAFQVANACTLPYAENSFDFVYSINLIHHIVAFRARQSVFAEIVRVLKPGGIFFLQEINTQNPLFAFYMGYIFPLWRDIDDGTEWWVKPSALPPVAGACWTGNTTHFTFAPDFTPPGLLSPLSRVEHLLEKTVPRWSAHYVAYLVKETS